MKDQNKVEGERKRNEGKIKRKQEEEDVREEI